MRIKNTVISIVLLFVMLFGCVIPASASSESNWFIKWDDAVSDETILSMSVGSDESQVRFCWLDKIGAQNAFRCGLTKALSEKDDVRVKSTWTITAQKRCTAIVNDLTSDTTYYYAYLRGGTWSETYSFHTSGSSLTALFVSDSQLGRSGDWRDKEVLLHDVAGWDTTLDKAAKAFQNVSLCLSAGDQTEIAFSERQYRLFLAPDTLRSLPIATTIGNHEFYFPYLNLHFAHPNRFGASILHSLGDEPYYFRQQNVLFIVLDTNNPLSWDQEAVLERAVRACPDTKWRVVMMHHSLYSCENSVENGPALRNSLVPLLQKYGVNLVLSGHTHRFSRSYPLWDNEVSQNGIVYLEGGCCSGCNCKASPETLPSYSAAGYGQNDPVFSVLRFDEQQIITQTFAVKNGDIELIDSGSVTSYERHDESAHSSWLVLALQNMLSVFGRMISWCFL